MKQLTITLDEFVGSNSLVMESDIECVFAIDASFSLKGQLYKISNSNNLTSTERLSLLLGRSACISEEWNFREFGEENWISLFTPQRKLGSYIIKSYSEIDKDSFTNRFYEFRSYFIEQTTKPRDETYKLNHTFYGNINFRNGYTIYDKNCLVNNIQNLEWDVFKQEEIVKCYANREYWYDQIWFIETKEHSYLFEEIIIS